VDRCPNSCEKGESLFNVKKTDN